MPLDNDNSFSIESPICPVEVFQELAENIEDTITDLLFEIHQNTDYIGKDSSAHAMKLVGLSLALHNLILCHFEKQLFKARYNDVIKKACAEVGCLHIDVKGIQN